MRITYSRTDIEGKTIRKAINWFILSTLILVSRFEMFILNVLEKHIDLF